MEQAECQFAAMLNIRELYRRLIVRKEQSDDENRDIRHNSALVKIKALILVHIKNVCFVDLFLPFRHYGIDNLPIAYSTAQLQLQDNIRMCPESVQDASRTHTRHVCAITKPCDKTTARLNKLPCHFFARHGMQASRKHLGCMRGAF